MTSAFRGALERELAGHETRTAPEMGWASKRNGELLTLAVGQFDVFLTADRNLSYQQDLSSFDIAGCCARCTEQPSR